MVPQDDVSRPDQKKLRFGWYALSSGFLGATASGFAKFALDPDSMIARATHSLVCAEGSDTHLVMAHHHYCYWIVFCTSRGFCLLAMILCNGYMLGTFLKGIEESGTVGGTALSTASNFLTSAIYGYLLWNERFTLLWWVGFTLVCVGVALLSVLKANNIKYNSTKNHSKQE
jgi:drug/metabolite transporter (DMT)-like permease